MDHVLNQELDRILVTIIRDDLSQEAEILTGDFGEIVKSPQILCHLLPILKAQVRKTSEGNVSATAALEKRVEDILVFYVFR